MTLEILEKIRQAEQKADEIRQNAVREGRDMIKASQEVAAKEEREAALLCRALYNKELNIKKDSVEKRIASYFDSNAAKRAAIIEAANQNIDKAVSLIIERIVANGNR